MSDALILLDKARDLGEQELKTLLSGEVEGLEAMACERLELIEQALKLRDSQKILEIRDKLIELQTQQGKLTNEAKRVREVLQEDLKRARQENKRFAGYGNAVRRVPLASRFVSRVW